MSALGITVLIILILLVPFAVGAAIAKYKGSSTPIFDGLPVGLLFWLFVGLALVIYSGVSRSESPDLVTLKKDEWSCVHTHTERRLVGKVPTRVDVCDTYQSIYTENE